MNTEILKELLAELRGLYFSYQHAHWESCNHSDHLLFERLYKGTTDDIDTLAEKIVSRGCGLCPRSQSVKMSEAVQCHDDLLGAERKFQKMISVAFDSCRGNLGMEDFLQSLASNRDTAIYLLGRNRGALMNVASRSHLEVGTSRENT